MNKFYSGEGVRRKYSQRIALAKAKKHQNVSLVAIKDS